MEVIHRQRNGERQLMYGCSACQRKGRAVCTNATVVPTDEMETALISTLKADLLHPEAVRRAVAAAASELTQGEDLERRRRSAEARLRELDGEIERLVAAVASASGASGPLLRAIEEREEEKRIVERELRQLIPGPTLDLSQLHRDLVDRVAQVREVLQANPVAARDVLAAILDEPLSAMERDGGWDRWSLRHLRPTPASST